MENCTNLPFETAYRHLRLQGYKFFFSFFLWRDDRANELAPIPVRDLFPVISGATPRLRHTFYIYRPVSCKIL